jgi:hypothetical protein
MAVVDIFSTKNNLLVYISENKMEFLVIEHLKS